MLEDRKAAAASDLARRPLDEAAWARRNERDERIVGLLNRGVAVADIAQREGVSLKRMRNCIRELLARREPQPPTAFLAEARRLEAALSVPFSMMANGANGANFRAIDAVIAIVRALDRCHGFSASPWRGGARLPRSSSPRRARRGPRDPQQTLDEARFGLGLADGPPTSVDGGGEFVPGSGAVGDASRRAWPEFAERTTPAPAATSFGTPASQAARDEGVSTSALDLGRGSGSNNARQTSGKAQFGLALGDAARRRLQRASTAAPTGSSSETPAARALQEEAPFHCSGSASAPQVFERARFRLGVAGAPLQPPSPDEPP